MANANRWLDTIEICLDHAERHGAVSNANGALDALISNLAGQFSTGIIAARADDQIQRWLALPFSMNPSVFVYQDRIVYRCCAMVLSGRFDKAHAALLGDRLKSWVSQWKRYDRKVELVSFINEFASVAAES